MATAIEYGLIAALVAVAGVSAVVSVQKQSEPVPACTDLMHRDFRAAVAGAQNQSITISNGVGTVNLKDGGQCILSFK